MRGYFGYYFHVLSLHINLSNYKGGRKWFYYTIFCRALSETCQQKRMTTNIDTQVKDQKNKNKKC